MLIKPSLVLEKILDGGGCHGGDAIVGDAVAEEVEAAVHGADGGFVWVLGEVEFAEGLVDDDDGAADEAGVGKGGSGSPDALILDLRFWAHRTTLKP